MSNVGVGGGEGNQSYYDENSTIILQEEIEDDYEPENEEILEYAKYLGMSLPSDNDLLYIAKEGLKAPLPDPWKPCKTSSNDIYYFNFESGESIWEHPCDKYYKEQYLKAKQNKLKDKHIVKEAMQVEKQEVRVAGGALIQLPKGSGSKASEKTNYQIKQMETNYENIVENYANNKKEELRDLQLKLLEQDNDIADQEEEELAEYREEIQNELSITLRQKKLKITKKMKGVREQKREEYKRKEEEEKELLKTDFDNFKGELKEDAENEHQMEVNHIEIEEQSRIEIEKNKLEFEIERQLEEKKSADENITNAQSKYLEKIEDEENLQEIRVNKALLDIKQDIAQRKKDEIMKLQKDVERKINNETTKMKVDSNYKKISEQSSKESARKEAENEYARKKVRLDEVMETKLTRTRQDQTEKYEDAKLNLEIELGVEKEKTSDLSQTRRISLQEEYARKFEKYLDDCQYDFKLEKEEYEREAKSRLDLMDLEFQEFSESFKNQDELLREMKKIKKRNISLSGDLNQKEIELARETNIANDNNTKVQYLQEELNLKRINTVPNNESYLEEGFTLGKDLFGEDSRVAAVKQEINEKDVQIQELNRYLEELKTNNRRAIFPTTEQFNDTSINITQPELQQVTNEVKELKKMIIRQKSCERTKLNKSAKKNRPRAPVKEAFGPPHEKNFMPANPKLKEIILFLGNERRDIDELTSHLIGEQKLFSKLKNQQEASRREWRQEIFRHRLDPSRKIVVNSLKAKMDHECEILDKQLNDIAYSIRKNEKKVGFLNHIDRKMEVLKNNLYNRDYGHVTQGMEKEIIRDYEFYMKTYKFDNPSAAQYQFNIPDPHAGQFLPSGMFNANQYEPKMKEETEYKYEEKNTPTKGYTEGPNNPWNFQNVGKQKYHGDFMGLAKSRERMMNVFIDQSNWLYQMKNEVSKTNFALNKPYF